MKKQNLKIVLLFFICCFEITNALAVGYYKTSSTIARLGIFSNKGYYFLYNRKAPYGYTDIALDTLGNIYIADYNVDMIRKLDPQTGISSILCGEGTETADSVIAIRAKISRPSSITIDKNGDIYFIERYNFKIKKIDHLTGMLTTFFELYGVYEGHALKFDKSGNLYFVIGGLVYKINKTTKLTSIVAGNSGALNIGDGGLAINAKLSAIGIAIDTSDNLFIADNLNKRIRIVDKSTGIINTYVGANPIDYIFPFKDSIPAQNLKIVAPRAMCFDEQNNLLFTDEGTGLLYKIGREDSTVYFAKEFNQKCISTIPYYSIGTEYLGIPQAVAYDSKTGNVYVTEMGQYNLKKLSMMPYIPKPKTDSLIFKCQYSKKDSLTAEGVNLKWYQTSIGGTAFPSAPIINTDNSDTVMYFVSQSIGGIESDRSAILIFILPAPTEPTLISKTDYCLNDTAAKIEISNPTDPSNNVFWYLDSALTNSIDYPILNKSIKGLNIFYAITYDRSIGCASKATKISVTIHHPELPDFKSPINLCLGRKADSLHAKGENIKWYSNLSSDIGTSTAPTPRTDQLYDSVFYLTQTDSFGCTSDTGSIYTYVHPTPPLPTAKTPNIYCQGEEAEALIGTGTQLKWYNSDSIHIGSNAPKPNTKTAGTFLNYLSQTNTFGCESDLLKIESIISPKPSIESKMSVVTPRTGFPIQLQASSDIGKQFLWNTTETKNAISYIPFNKGKHTFWVISISDNGCKSDTSRQEIEVDADDYWLGKIDIYPNPFSEYIKVTGLNLKDVRSIILYTIDRKKILESEIPAKSFTLNIPTYLPSGYYIVEINTVGMANPSKLIYKN